MITGQEANVVFVYPLAGMKEFDAHVGVVVIDVRTAQIAPIGAVAAGRKDDAVNVGVLALLLAFETAKFAGQILFQIAQKGCGKTQRRVKGNLRNDLLDHLPVKHDQIHVVIGKGQTYVIGTGIVVDQALLRRIADDQIFGRIQHRLAELERQIGQIFGHIAAVAKAGNGQQRDDGRRDVGGLEGIDAFVGIARQGASTLVGALSSTAPWP